MVAALVNCGGSGDSSSDTRQRNAALECLPGDPAETTTTIENDPCAETTTTLYENESNTLTCDVRWEPGAVSGTVTACPEATWLETSYPNTVGGSSGTSNQGAPSNRLGFGQYGEGTATVTVHIEKDGATVAMGTVQFQTNVAATQSFTYEAPKEADPNAEVEVSCTLSWDPGTNVLTSCPNVHLWWDISDTRGFSQGNGSTTSLSASIDPAGLDSLYIRAYAVLAVDYDGSSGFGGNPTKVSELKLAEKSSDTFTYKALASSLAEAATTTTTEAPAAEETTTTTETPAQEETTTTVDSGQEVASTLSVQEVPCQVTYTASTGTVTLCESFDRVVGATFDNDGKFTESIEAKGDQFTIPRDVLQGNGARFLRVATGQKLEGRDIATFRGEGIIDLGDTESDVVGTIYVSPAGEEALNTGGYPDYLEAELTDAGLFDLDDIEEDQFAFVTLNGEIFTEYENVKPPASWDEGKPLAWRVYQLDGFGLPRLVASGTLALGSSADVDYANPAFELNATEVEVLQGENAGRGPDTEGLEEDPCGEVQPFMITTPITPSRTNMVTLTVATDCRATDSILGLVVNAYDEGWIPIFSQFKSTRYTSRLTATVFLADGAYDILWGNNFLVGVHEYVVNGGGTGATCHHPRLDVDAEAKTATLRDCDPGAHRMRIFAEPLFWTDMEDDIRLPFKDNVIDLSMVPWDGYFVIDPRIDDTDEPEFVTCINACDTAIRADEGIYIDFDQSGFATDGGVDVTSQCVMPPPPDVQYVQSWTYSYTDIYREAGEGSFVFENWKWNGSRPWEPTSEKSTKRLHFPDNGKLLAVTSCGGEYTDWTNWGFNVSKGIHMTEITEPMPNQPSNDRFENAPAIEPGVGRIQFTNVSSTNDLGEMGIEYSNSMDAGQFHSVWFKYTPEESGRTTFRVTDYSFDVLMRVTSVDGEGRTVLHDEAEMWIDDPIWCECDYSEEETASFYANSGTTYYIQITNEDWENQVGTATLLVNGGEGETVTVPAGDQKFVGSADLQSQAPPTTVPPVTTTSTTSTTVAPVDTVAPGSPTTTAAPTQQQQSYAAAVEQGSRNEVATVLAPVGDGPATVEARKDARTVEIPVVDLYGTVSAASANVDTTRSLMIRQSGRRPIRVNPTDRTVSVPLGTEVSELNIVARDTAGKVVTAPLTVKKTVAPLVTVAGSGDSGSGLPVLPIGIAVAILALAGAGFILRRRGTTPATDAPTED